MPSLIRPNRTEVSRSFPVLGFTVRTGEPAWFEVALATEPGLFASTAKPKRTAQTFWSSRDLGPLPAERGEAVFLVPSEVLSRFAGQSRVYFSLATFRSPGRQNPEVMTIPAAAAPSVAISRSFTGATRRLAAFSSTRPRRGDGYAAGTGTLEWAGDAAQPGTVEPVAARAGNGNGAGNGHGATAVQSGYSQPFHYDDGYGSMEDPGGGTSQTATRPLGAVSVNIPDVELVPQPTGKSCWAAAATMVVAWRDYQSVDPVEIARGSGYWARYQNNQGLNPSDRDELAATYGLAVEAPQNYTVDGFAQLLQDNGPLWVGVAVPSGHAVVAIGVEGDGTPDGTWVIYHDPWPPGVGAASQRKTYRQFMTEYENRLTVDDTGNVNIQITHANGRRPVSVGQGLARPQSAESFDLFWPDVPLIPQTANNTCWAAASAMVASWAARTPVSAAPGPGGYRSVDSQFDLIKEPQQNYPIETLRDMLAQHGPLYVSAVTPFEPTPSYHAVVITGMYSDGAPDGSDTYVRINDPWDRDPGTPGRPGRYLGTYDHGSTYILPFAEFLREYEAVPRDPNIIDTLQIMYSRRGPGGRTPTMGASTLALAAANGHRTAYPLAAVDVHTADVELVPQQTGMSCWAASAAMVVGWRDRVSIDPGEVARGAGHWADYSTGLNPNDRDELAAAWGLVVEPPQNYTVEGFARLLQDNGPLWVGVAVPSGHAVVATGVEGDGTPDSTWVIYHDPWPPHVGAADQRKTYRQFMTEYENRLTVDDTGNVNVQILHANGRQPVTTSQGLRPGLTRPFSGESFDVFWSDVQLINQQSGDSCSAAAAAMVAGWAGLSSVEPGDRHEGHEVVAQRFGLSIAPAQNYSIDGFRRMLEDHGPLWVAAVVEPDNTHHAVAVTGMYSDGNPDGSDTYVRINDPWDVDPGRPGTPGAVLPTHDHGSTYILTWAQFLRQYERVPRGGADNYDQIQVLYAPGGPGGRRPGPGASTLGLVQGNGHGPRRPARQLAVVEIASAIVGAAMTRILDNEGDITWELDQLQGLKYPRNDQTQGSGRTFSSTTIAVPSLKTASVLGADEIYADIEITYQWDGRALGNIQIAVTRPNDAVGLGLTVKAQIMDEANVFTANGSATMAAVKVRIQYRFNGVSNASDAVGFCDLMLYGNGTWSRRYRWTQEW